MFNDQWLPTPVAAQALHCSESFLRRNRDLNPNGFLTNGKHWRWGTAMNRPMLWNVPAIEQAINRRGKQLNKDCQAAREAAK